MAPAKKTAQKKAARKKTAQKKTAQKKTAQKKTAHGKLATASAATFDGDRVLKLMGKPHDSPDIAAVYASLGHMKPSNPDDPDLALKKLGVVFRFEARNGKDVLTQVQFEIRRKWTGHARYLGRLPYGMSPDLPTTQATTVLAAQALTVEPMTSTDWCSFHFADHEIALGFGKTFLETVFVIAK